MGPVPFGLTVRSFHGALMPVKALRPVRCPGCSGDARHPYSCPVLVRLAAQFLARRVGPPWREAASALARRDPGGMTAAAQFWQDVSGDPEPPDMEWTPDLRPTGDGLEECEEPAGENLPGFMTLVSAVRLTPMGRSTLLVGATLPAAPLHAEPRETPCDSSASSPAPVTPTPASSSPSGGSPSADPTSGTG